MRLSDFTEPIEIEKNALFGMSFGAKNFLKGTRHLADKFLVGLKKDVTGAGGLIEGAGNITGKVYRSSVPAAKMAWGAATKAGKAVAWPSRQFKEKMMLKNYNPTTKRYQVANKAFTGKGKKATRLGVPGEYVATGKQGRASIKFVPEFVHRTSTRGQRLRHTAGKIGHATTSPFTLGAFGLLAAAPETLKRREPMVTPTYF